MAGLPSRRADATDPATPNPVIMVHGYSFGDDCPGGDVNEQWWGLELFLQSSGYTGQEVPVSYYECDNRGTDITGYDQYVPADASTSPTEATPRVSYDRETPPDTVAHDLAWFLYDSYSSRGVPVDVVAASFGGLLTRDALQQVSDGNPDFPPYLLVDRAITLSTPHAGWGTVADATATCNTEQCRSLATDSPFIEYLNSHAGAPQGRGGTSWTLIGSSAGCDFFTGASTLAMAGTTRIDYDSPCYAHTGYQVDFSTDDDAAATLTTADGDTSTSSTLPHALLLIRDVLSSPVTSTVPTPAPTPTSTDPTPAPTTSSSDPTPTPTPTSAPTASDPTPAPTPTSTPAPTPTASDPTPAPAPAPTPTASDPTPPAAGSTQDRTPPTVALSGTTGVVVRGPVVVTVDAADAGGVASLDLRYRQASTSGASGSYVYPTAWQRRTGTTVSLTPVQGTRYCVSARARDTGGVVSQWSAERCSVSPLDDRTLTAGRAGWSQATGRKWFGGTYSVARTAGATTAVRAVDARASTALVVATCSGCGSVQVYANGRPWRTVDTRSARTRYRVVLPLPGLPAGTTSITLRTASSAPVYLDGLVVDAR